MLFTSQDLLHDRFRGPLSREPSEQLLVSPQLQPEAKPPNGGETLLEKPVSAGANIESTYSSKEALQASTDEYEQLQMRLYIATVLVSLVSVVVAAVLFDFHTSLSLLIGALSGVIYLRLLARGVGRLGKGVKSVGKVQLLVPIILVLSASKFSQLDLLPALLGFLLYKPSLILQVLFESRTKVSS